MQTLVDGLDTYYERQGETGSPKLLILHGWSDSAAGWRSFMEGLAKHFDVVVVDLPGFGQTALPEQAWDLHDYAAFAGAFCKKIRFRPQVVLGHSNGGAIAIRGLATGTLTAGSLVLLNSSGLRSDYHGCTKTLRILTKIGKILSYALPSPVRRRLRHAVYRTLGSDVVVKEGLQETYKRIVTDDVQTNAAQMKLPTLLVYGADDEVTPVQYGRILHSLMDGSSLEVIPAAGHFVHRDQPDRVLKVMTDFLV